jgi:hypothetical protein
MFLAPLYSAPFRKVASTEAKHELTTVILNLCVHKYFFTTSKGYIGVCPRSTEPGDIIVFLSGGKIPYILREKDIESCGSIP